jgi:hypothetical protein
MNAPFASQINVHALPDEIDTRSPEEVFIDLCGARAAAIAEGILSKREAADELQGYAKLSGLIGAIGQDTVQLHMAQAFAAFDVEPEGYDVAADLVRQWEIDDPRDRWKHTREAPPPKNVRNGDISGLVDKPRSYRTPQSVIDAFLYVAKNHDAAYLARWLDQHPQDVATLTKLWEAKNGNS